VKGRDRQAFIIRKLAGEEPHLDLGGDGHLALVAALLEDLEAHDDIVDQESQGGAADAEKKREESRIGRPVAQGEPHPDPETDCREQHRATGQPAPSRRHPARGPAARETGSDGLAEAVGYVKSRHKNALRSKGRSRRGFSRQIV